MSTLREIVADGFRESGISPVGADPEADEFDEGLRRLQIIIKTLIGNQFGDKLSEINYGSQGLTRSHSKAEDISDIIDSIYIPLNSRVVFNNEAVTTVYLHPSPQDGSRLSVIDSTGNFATNTVTLNGNGRKVESAASVLLNTNSLQREWFYRADQGNWVRVTDLTDSSESPFPQEFDDYLSLLLAMRLNPRFGAETREELMMSLRRYESQFRSRYRQTMEMDVDEGLLRLDSNKRYRAWDVGSTDRFNRGWDY